MNLIIHIDGGARGNPGPAGVGVVIHDAESGAAVHEAGYFVGRTTNNVAEYHGLLKALAAARELGAKQVDIRSDSQLMVRQITGQYRVKSEDLRPLYEQARQHLAALGKWRIEHIRREQNARADALANLAMDARKDVTPDGNAGSAGGSAGGPWEITVTGSTAQCPAGVDDEQTWTLDAMVPPGLCTHAAAAAFAAGLPDQLPAKAPRCAVCRRTLRIRQAE